MKRWILPVVLLLFINTINATDPTPVQTPLHYRTVTSGDWNAATTWETSTDNINWNQAIGYPTSSDNSILIRTGHTVKTTGINNLTIDDVVIETGGSYWNANGTTLKINDGSSAVDLLVEGTFIDSSNIEIVWLANSGWEIGAQGTLIKTTNTGINNWQTQYSGGIVSIPSTSNWIFRKPAGAFDEPSLNIPTNSSITTACFGNVVIENNSSSWNSSSSCNFSGNEYNIFVKGNLWIGGNGTGIVEIKNTNNNADPLKVIGDVNIKTGSTFNVTGTGLHIEGDINCNGTFTQGTSNSRLHFSGNQNQLVNGGGSISANYVEINKMGGNVTLNNNISIQKNLTLLSGVLECSLNQKVIIQDNATVTNASDISFISGAVQKVGDDAFTFPVGKNGVYHPVSMNGGTGNSTSDAFTAEYFNENPRIYFENNYGSGIENISACEYWTFNMDVGAAQKNVMLSWDGNNCAITNMASLRVARFNQSIWVDEGNLFTTGNLNSGIISSIPSTGYGAFTIATVNESATLPITLLNFSATYNGREVKLSWVTSAEINNELFTIEKSRDGKYFEPVLTQPGAGTSNQHQYYSAEDFNPYLNISYYRLKQTSYDGKFSFSDIVPIRVKIDEASIISIQSSKANSSISFDVNFPQAVNGVIKIIDLNGKLAYGAKFSSPASQKHFTIESSQMPTGVYFLQLQFEGQVIEKKFIY